MRYFLVPESFYPPFNISILLPLALDTDLYLFNTYHIQQNFPHHFSIYFLCLSIQFISHFLQPFQLIIYLAPVFLRLPPIYICPVFIILGSAWDESRTNIPKAPLYFTIGSHTNRPYAYPIDLTDSLPPSYTPSAPI